MKYITLITLALVLSACGESHHVHNNPNTCYTERVEGGVNIVCEDSTAFIPDGEDGTDGSDGSVLTSTTVSAGQCVEIVDGVWAENIHSGKLIDVYSNSSCADNKGELCDNLIPAHGRAGSNDSNHHPGSGTVCWASNHMVTATKDSKNVTDITINVITFN